MSKRGLYGKTVVVTRAASQSGEFSRMLEGRGASVLECPTIELFPNNDSVELDAAIDSLEQFDWLILTSANAVKFFFELLARKGMESSLKGGCRLCVVGPKTAEMAMSHRMIPDLVPESFDGEGVVEAFRQVGVDGARILFPRADRARDVIPSGLKMLGADVSDPVLYLNRPPETLPPEVVDALENRKVDLITFSASSTVTNLAELLGGKERLCKLLETVNIASIGPVTSRTCRDLGLVVDIEPEKATLVDLTDAMEFFLNELNQNRSRASIP